MYGKMLYECEIIFMVLIVNMDLFYVGCCVFVEFSIIGRVVYV